jgi:hypothetical protein
LAKRCSNDIRQISIVAGRGGWRAVYPQNPISNPLFIIISLLRSVENAPKSATTWEWMYRDSSGSLWKGSSELPPRLPPAIGDSTQTPERRESSAPVHKSGIKALPSVDRVIRLTQISPQHSPFSTSKRTRKEINEYLTALLGGRSMKQFVRKVGNPPRTSGLPSEEAVHVKHSMFDQSSQLGGHATSGRSSGA